MQSKNALEEYFERQDRLKEVVDLHNGLHRKHRYLGYSGATIAVFKHWDEAEKEIASKRGIR